MSERKWWKMDDFRGFTFVKVIICRFSKHKWTKMMSKAGFPRFFYCKSDHWSIFNAGFHLSTTSVPTGLPRAERWMIDFQSLSERKWCKIEDFRRLLLEKWSLVDFQSISESKWCEMDDFRGFTIVKVSMSRFSKHTWTKMMQNEGNFRFYFYKSEHWSNS